MTSPGATGTAALPRQAGFTLWSGLYVLLTLGAIVYVGIRCVPVYINNYEVQKTLNRVASEPDLRNAGLASVRRAVSRSFSSGYVTEVTARDVDLTRTDAGRSIEINYEVRRPLWFNMSLIMSFHDSAPMHEEAALDARR